MMLLLIKNKTVFFYHQPQVPQPRLALQPLRHRPPTPLDPMDDENIYIEVQEV